MNKFMALAYKEADKALKNGDGEAFGAVITKDNQILGVGHDEVKKNHDPTCHGEIMAIHDACQKTGSFDLSGCSIYTTEEPCPMCLGAILWANIGKIYYGSNAISLQGIQLKKGSPCKEKEAEKEDKEVKELDRESCLKLYDDYLRIKGKKNY